MDCRQALQILDFNHGDSGGLPSEVYPADDRAAAEAHLESCPACARTVRNRQELDRTIGQVMRAVPIPRGAQQRLLARISEIEAADSGSERGQPAASCERAAGELAVGPSNDPELARNGKWTAAAGTSDASVGLARSFPGRASRRRFLKSLVPLAVCLVVALTGFYGVVWLFMPGWTVDDVSQSLAQIDFPMLETLGDFTGNDAAARLTREPGWQRLKWVCGPRAKGLPVAPNVIAVYGFVVPQSRRDGSIDGLIAVIPKSRIHTRPIAESLATAAPTSGYLPARIGESVCVAWQQGDYVYVCLIRGGADSLETLQSALEEPAA